MGQKGREAARGLHVALLISGGKGAQEKEFGGFYEQWGPCWQPAKKWDPRPTVTRNWDLLTTRMSVDVDSLPDPPGQNAAQPTLWSGIARPWAQNLVGTHRCWTSDPPHWEIVSGCCFKLPSFWVLITQPQDTTLLGPRHWVLSAFCLVHQNHQGILGRRCFCISQLQMRN